MKAAVVPAVHSRWEIREVPTPEPGPNQVLIKIRASGICYTDVHQTEGELPGEFPRILGHEPVGQIVAVGAGVTTRKVGDRVGVPWIQSTCGRCEWCKRGRPMFCAQLTGTSGVAQGGHAEYMVAYADAAMLLPDGLSYEQAAPIFCAAAFSNSLPMTTPWSLNKCAAGLSLLRRRRKARCRACSSAHWEPSLKLKSMATNTSCSRAIF